MTIEETASGEMTYTTASGRRRDPRTHAEARLLINMQREIDRASAPRKPADKPVKTSSGQALKPRTFSKRASKPAATAKPADKPASVQSAEEAQAAYQEVLDAIYKPALVGRVLAAKSLAEIQAEEEARPGTWKLTIDKPAGAVTVTATSGHVARLQELRVRWSAATKRAAAKRASARKATERVAYWRAQIDAYDALGLDAWRGSPATA